MSVGWCEKNAEEPPEACTRLRCILVPRGRDPFGQHQESRPLAAPKTGSPRFTDS